MTDPQKLQAEPEDRALRLDVFLAQRLTQLTRSQIQSLNRSGAVLIDGRREKAGYKIRGGERIEVDLGFLREPALEGRYIPFKIVFEDDDFAVVEKPAGIAIHPGAGTGNETMVHALVHHFQTLSTVGGETRPGIVHRLDKWTSGLLVIAKNDWTHTKLSRAFQERLVEKRYVALVHGKFPNPQGEIALNIGRHTTNRTRMQASKSRGRSALSLYRVIEEIRGFSLLEVTIKTGRTHQIRVHLSAVGHPVVGDGVYGEAAQRDFVRRYCDPGRYFLHAAMLRFAHPRTGVVQEYRSALPAELEELLARIREG